MSRNPIIRLWRGEIPLYDAFWHYAVFIGIAVNLTTSVMFLGLLTYDLMLPAALAGYGLSVPYNILAVVGVWRSAERYDGAKSTAELARVASLIWIVFLSVT